MFSRCILSTVLMKKFSELSMDIDRAKQLYSRLDEIYNRNSYDEMLYSIRPLKVKYWFTEEEIKTFNLSDL